MKRREILKGGLALSGIGLLGGRAPAIIAAESTRPQVPLGVMSGDMLPDRSMIWAATDRPAHMVVEWSREPDFKQATRVAGPLASAQSAFTAKLDLGDLPVGQMIHYRVAFRSDADPRAIGPWSPGRVQLPGGKNKRIRFTFSGDEAGQGFGINREWGGYRLYEAMRRMKPDFFIHQGDQIYADGPLKEEVALPGGKTWRNMVTPAKAHVAETLDDYRGAFAYNLLDDNKRRFLAEVPMLVQWDDHEVRNNWFPDKPLATGPSMRDLAVRSRQAMLEYNPIRIAPAASGIQRRFSMGSLLDIFMLDERSRRGPNAAAADAGPGAGIMGAEQVDWLKRELLASKATWKIIASDMPISLTVPDLNKNVAPGGIEGIANGKPGAPGGREAEIADLLSFMKAHGIGNSIWITADIHYASAIHYHPERASFGEFLPFWEIVAGPINAGTGNLTMNPLDPTFGPEIAYASVPQPVEDTSPMAGLQYFGMGEVDPETGILDISIHDITGRTLWSRKFAPDAALFG